MKNKISTYIAIILALLLASIILVGLILWTKNIQDNKDEIKFEELLQTTIERDGVQGLLKKANVDVDNIYTTEEGLEVFVNTNYESSLSIEEEINKSVYQKGKESVVYITSANDELTTQGSGIVISTIGYILTNKHVIAENADEIYVSLNNGEKKKATLVGSDSATDIALLKIDSNNLKPVVFGYSSTVTIGQNVWALTNPQGFERSLTSGIISGLSRPVRDLDKGLIMDMIQTDAVVSKGSSGGALFDSRARLIGIITSIESESGRFEGTAFAIPIETTTYVVPQLIEYGYVKRGWVDFNFIALNSTISEYAKLNIDSGLLVNQLIPGGKSSAAGLKAGTEKVKYGNSIVYLGGDVITKVNSVDVKDFSDFYVALSNTRPDDTVTMQVYRDGEYKEIDIKLIERPQTIGK